MYNSKAHNITWIPFCKNVTVQKFLHMYDNIICNISRIPTIKDASVENLNPSSLLILSPFLRMSLIERYTIYLSPRIRLHGLQHITDPLP